MNNKSWSKQNSNFGVGKVNGLYYFTTGSSTLGEFTSFYLGGVPSTPGTLNFSHTGAAVAHYYDESGHKFTSRSGSVVITAIDTLPNPLTIKNLKGTFSFKTDTFNNVSYDITEGGN